MKFSALPIGKFFIHKNSDGEFYGWTKVDAFAARKTTPLGQIYGEPVTFSSEEETLVDA